MIRKGRLPTWFHHPDELFQTVAFYMALDHPTNHHGGIVLSYKRDNQHEYNGIYSLTKAALLATTCLSILY